VRRRATVAPPTEAQAIREATGPSQSAFAALLGVGARTLQDREQHRRKPTGAAPSLLRIAEKRPDILLDVAS
jgi:putative transcriptional regulator